MTNEQLAIIKEFNRNVRYLRERDRKNNTWVKSGTIKRITGWNNEEMRKAREQGLVEWKREKGIWYLLESIPEIFKTHDYDSKQTDSISKFRPLHSM